ncbi:MAG: hypothetical protein EOP45_04115 [Sphingobacteriaceae bacterium]|nr:MAG: hypothetical protein EOP45_04115 [Sphingobacteriaceae bacterium]
MNFHLKPNFTLKDLDKRYKELRLLHHPDKGGNEQEFKKLAETYETFKDMIQQGRKENWLDSKCKGGCWCCEPISVEMK